jgi:hypothetical protein
MSVFFSWGSLSLCCNVGIPSEKSEKWYQPQVLLVSTTRLLCLCTHLFTRSL